jgi:hypothetical protein
LIFTRTTRPSNARDSTRTATVHTALDVSSYTMSPFLASKKKVRAKLKYKLLQPNKKKSEQNRKPLKLNLLYPENLLQLKSLNKLNLLNYSITLRRIISSQNLLK